MKIFEQYPSLLSAPQNYGKDPVIYVNYPHLFQHQPSSSFWLYMCGELCAVNCKNSFS